MKKNQIVMITIFFVFSSLSLFAAGKTKTSGKIENGLRILKVENEKRDLDFTIFRGDYIVFDFSKKGSNDFTVSGLDIDTVMPRPADEKAYVKMKKSGTYNFTLGNRKGTFTVLELADPSYKEVTAADADKLIENSKSFILDVRTTGEFNGAHIENAEHINVQVLSRNLKPIMKHKDEPVLVYCASGNRSTVAARILMNAGFTKVYNLRYGIGDWYRRGFPIVQ